MGEPELGVRVKLDLVEKRGRFLEPSLTPSKLRAADQGLERHARPAARELLHRCLESCVGLVPRSAPDEDRPVVGPADGEKLPDSPPLGKLEHSLAPLRRTLEVPHPLAGGDHVTAGASHRPQLRHLAGDRRCRRFVQLADTVSDFSFTSQRETLEPERRELDVEYSERASDRPRAPGQAPRGRDVVLEKEGDFTFADRKPAVLRHRVEAVEQTMRALKPAARNSRLAAEGEIVPREPDGHPSGAGSVATLTVEAVRAFSRLNRELPVVEPPGRHGESLDGFDALASFLCGLEIRPRLLPVPPAQRFVARSQRIRDLEFGLWAHRPHTRLGRIRTSMAAF